MKISKLICVSAFVLMGISVKAETGMIVKSVTAQQRYPWNGLVDIAVTLTGESKDVANANFCFTATNSETKAALSVSHISRSGDAVGSGTTWLQKFVWDAAADVGAVKIDDVALTVDAKILGGVQLWENGPYWAECNVGATKPEEYGYYFWWGDTLGYKPNASNDGWESFKDGSAYRFSRCVTCNKNNSTLQAEGYIDSTGNLVAAHDAATAHLGAPWRMPTASEIDALISNCDLFWTTRNGVWGRLLKGRGAYASKSIFLPAAGVYIYCYPNNVFSYGEYWSSTPYSDDCSAWSLFFNSPSGPSTGYYFRRSCAGRDSGLPVRPLRGFAK